MKSHHLVIALTVVNFGLVLFHLFGPNPAGAGNSQSVLQASGLQIVDAQGRVRASLSIEPASTTNGTTSPETVLFRLIDENGQPSVKIATSDTRSGLSFVGGDDQSYLILQADGPHSSLKIVGPDGKQQFLAP